MDVGETVVPVPGIRSYDRARATGAGSRYLAKFEIVVFVYAGLSPNRE